MKRCTDGVVRTLKEYRAWIKSLAQLARSEPTDLTEEEKEALIDAGCGDLLWEVM